MLKRAPIASDDNMIILVTPDDKLITVKKNVAPFVSQVSSNRSTSVGLCFHVFSLSEKSHNLEFDLNSLPPFLVMARI